MSGAVSTNSPFAFRSWLLEACDTLYLKETTGGEFRAYRASIYKASIRENVLDLWAYSHNLGGGCEGCALSCGAKRQVHRLRSARGTDPKNPTLNTKPKAPQPKPLNP